MTSAATVFRDYVIDGNPGSGAWNPQKADIRALLAGLLNNTPTDINGSYTVQSADAGNTLFLNSGIGTISYGGANGYSATHANRIVNLTTRRWYVSFPGGAFIKLYPNQVMEAFNHNGAAWAYTPQQRWKTIGTTLYADSGLGNDVNGDGLQAGTQAVQTLNQVFTILGKDLDLTQAPWIIYATGTFTELVVASGWQPVNYMTGTFQGPLAGSCIWRPDPVQKACITLGDYFICEFSNVKFDSGGVTGCIAYNGHQSGITDWLSGMELGNFSGGTHILLDHGGAVFNMDASYTISGPATTHISMGPGTVMEFVGGISWVFSASPPSIGTFVVIAGSGASLQFVGTMGKINDVASGCLQYAADFNSSIQLAGTVIPGSVMGTFAHGAQVV